MNVGRKGCEHLANVQVFFFHDLGIQELGHGWGKPYLFMAEFALYDVELGSQRELLPILALHRNHQRLRPRWGESMHTQQANVLSAVNGDETESAPVDRSSNVTLPIGAHVHNSRMPLNHLPRIEQDLGLKRHRSRCRCRRGCMGGCRCWCRCGGGSSGGCWRACGRWRGGLSDCGGRRRHHGDATGQLRQKQRHRCNRSQRPGAATFALSIDVHHPVARLTPTTGTGILPTACRRTVQRPAIPDTMLRPMRPC
ncbi:hypothetical protein ES703_79135 [subsurface metagenome]